MNKDRDYIIEAYQYASKFSTDPSTSNGALLITTNGLKLLAANHFPAGVKDNIENRWVKPLKYSFIEHAERNVIFKAANLGVSTNGSTLYCPWFACADCARAIIQSGITEVIGHDLPLHSTHLGWKDTIDIALAMFDEAGVKYRWIKGEMGGIPIKFNGQNIKV